MAFENSAEDESKSNESEFEDSDTFKNPISHPIRGTDKELQTVNAPSLVIFCEISESRDRSRSSQCS
jgi:hypothetical protein